MLQAFAKSWHLSADTMHVQRLLFQAAAHIAAATTCAAQQLEHFSACRAAQAGWCPSSSWI
jgi:hypothetical protein